MSVLCCAIAWILVWIALSDLWTTIRDGVASVKRSHQIPCANCQFFTNSPYLKCTIHPCKALTEDAINCYDYYPQAHQSVYE